MWHQTQGSSWRCNAARRSMRRERGCKVDGVRSHSANCCARPILSQSHEFHTAAMVGPFLNPSFVTLLRNTPRSMQHHSHTSCIVALPFDHHIGCTSASDSFSQTGISLGQMEYLLQTGHTSDASPLHLDRAHGDYVTSVDSRRNVPGNVQGTKQGQDVTGSQGRDEWTKDTLPWTCNVDG